MLLDEFFVKRGHGPFLECAARCGKPFSCINSKTRVKKVSFWLHLWHIISMANVIIRPDWNLPESAVTPEAAYRNRRQFLKTLGLGAGLGGGLLAGDATAAATAAQNLKRYPGKRNAKYNPNFRTTPQQWAAGFNNFYEFSTDKFQVQRMVGAFRTEPWPVTIGGLCKKPFKMDAQDMVAKFGIEERVYRFRCVEGWGMILPWSGFSLRRLLELAEPTKEARYVKFTTAMIPRQMPGIARLPQYPWPYTEGLRIAEAMHDLTFVATGMYGKPLLKQNGAPIRLVVPWKYGYKSIKSIVKIEFVRNQPKTLWNSLSAVEYPFESNVDPAKPHPRWSQASEEMKGMNGLRVRTLKYNGYGAVAGLYRR
jgi:sulfoxide reductase catalytic subunit YedY